MERAKELKGLNGTKQFLIDEPFFFAREELVITASEDALRESSSANTALLEELIRLKGDYSNEKALFERSLTTLLQDKDSASKDCEKLTLELLLFKTDSSEKLAAVQKQLRRMNVTKSCGFSDD